ncbi:nucleotidyltransferase domain-containing protein [Labedaea rhizosphaerae]|uniref:Nucleotidyltransferase-like protein n=1 Tax=Labedaea rhizosphaerae TaxID=598644 RepID=A0A4R6SKL0_LABRH|nr:nucleotidyltransferase domain-containing protein [Labedaea rhizosphaerae]TDQ04609.1 nucleotidyltransferase-like protein [Labedaea rhizosphaerae]
MDRLRVVDQVGAALEGLVPGSRVSLRGSLARGTADKYSDIDLLWVVPDASFTAALDGLPQALTAATRRVDPDFARSDRRRLVFLRLPGLPLFWRIDLDVRAASVADDEHYDVDNPAARSTDGWSAAASALENAIAAVKAERRGRSAEGLLERGFARIGRANTGSPYDLADACVAIEPGLRELADELKRSG